LDKDGRPCGLYGEVQQQVWYGVVGSQSQVVITPEIRSLSDLRTAVVEGLTQVHAAPVSYADERPQGKVRLSQSWVKVWEPCSRCGRPVDPDGDGSWIGDRAYCSTACEAEANPARSFMEPPKPRVFSTRWTWKWFNGDWERVPVS
jgi:hypothetical protein